MTSRAEASAEGDAPAGPPGVPPSRTRLRPVPILALAGTGALTVLIASRTTLVTEVPIAAQFGLLQLLPWVYWVGLGLMGLSVYLGLRSGRTGLFLFNGALLFSLFAGTPVLFESNPPVWDAYVHFGEVQDIMLEGGLPEGFIAYSSNWPGFFLLGSTLDAVTGLGPLEMLFTYPFLTSSLTFVALFLLLRALFSPSTAAVGSVLGSLLNAWAQFHFSPQSVGLVLILLVLATVWRRRVAYRVAATLLFIALLLSHPTSTVLILSIFVLQLVLSRVRRPEGRAAREERPAALAYSPALPFGVAWLAWLFFLARGSTETAEVTLLTRMSRILQVPEETLNLATASSVESLYLWPPLIRLGILGAFGLLALVGLFALSRRSRSRPVSRLLLAVILSLVLFTLADILLTGGSFFDRAFILFALLGPAIIVAGFRAMRVRRATRRAVLFSLLVGSLAVASTTYYLEAFYFVSDNAVAVSGFLERAEPNAIVLDGFYPHPVWAGIEDRTPYSGVPFFVVHPRPFEEFEGGTVLAIFDPTADIWYRQWRGIEVYEFYRDGRAGHSLIYDNGQTTIYFINP